MRRRSHLLAVLVLTCVVLTCIAGAARADSQAPPQWIATASGLVRPLGTTPALGDLAGVPLNQPIVGAWGTPSGHGFWLVASDGGVFTFGDAAFFGGLGGTHLNAPIIALAATPSGQGYWLLGADGGVFTFGDAAFFGSDAGLDPTVAFAPTPTGQGYWILHGDGHLTSHGDAVDLGQLAFAGLLDVAGLARTPSGHGLWVIGADGVVAALGDAVRPEVNDMVLAIRPDGSAVVPDTSLPAGAVAMAGPGWGAVLRAPLLLRPATGVALTFDDGPDPRWTPQLLDLLDAYGVKATFFVTGANARAHPDLVREIARRGHRIGNHTENHPALARLDVFSQFAQIASATEAIEAAGAPPPRCVRPPYGSTDALVAAVIAANGMAQELWNVDPRDFDRPGTKTIVQRATASLRPGRIILMHDGGRDRSQTLAAVPSIITLIHAAGLRIEPIC